MNDLLETKAELLGSLLLFTQVFFKLRTGRDFEISQPHGRESHHLTICRELTKVFYGETNRLLINVPPGHGKSEMTIHFIAWAMAHYPDSAFIYISYSQELAARHTHSIKKIIELPHYRKLFGVEVRQDSKAKDNFTTNYGGIVKAFGSSGSITGQDSGLPNLSRFSGGTFMDDMHKPDEVHSDAIREGVIKNYNETIKPRPRGPNVPTCFIGQRLHELDLPAYFISGGDGYEWNQVILPALDEHENILHPTATSRQMLLIEKEKNPYVFSSQYQQRPQPAGGGIFQPEWFVLMDEEPKILATFITADTAETSKDFNDATVFSFWGIYKIVNNEHETDLYGLHWIHAIQIRIEPKDLYSEFMNFYTTCMTHKVKPRIVAIEKKSTGVTLCSVLSDFQGLRLMDIQRTIASKSKSDRFLALQPYVSSKHVSLPRYGKHTHMCIEHCRKITANNTHAYDDIADTLYDAIKIALIDEALIYQLDNSNKSDMIVQKLANKFNKTQTLLNRAYR